MSDPTRERSAVFGPLVGIAVVELGDGVAGAAATDTLAALGAEVTTFADRRSILRGSAPLVRGQSIQSAILDSRKRVVTSPAAADVLRAIADAEVVVCDRVLGVPSGLPVILGDYLDFVAASNPGAWVTISAYGMRGARAVRPGSDLTVAASAGWLGASLDRDTGRPTSMLDSQALQMAGTATALAVCHALSERLATGRAQHADVSAQAAVALGGHVLSAAGRLLSSDEVGGAVRFGAPVGRYECRDGPIWITAMEEHQWLGLVRALGQPAWAAQFEGLDARIDQAAECNVALATEFARWNRLELETALQKEGMPAAVIRDAADLLASPQFFARGSIRTIAVGSESARVVDTAQKAVEAGDARVPDRPATIRGLRILEASHILAVPLAGAMLGACGAEVIKLEERRRPDSYRTRPPYVDGHADPDWSAYLALTNHSKHSLDVDLSRPAVVSTLLESTDVIMENFGPSRARRAMIDSYQALEHHPDLLAISSSGFGHTGPWASYRAYASSLHAAAGLVHFTPGESGRAVQPAMPVADLMTGYALATYVAAWAVGPGRRTGIALDVAMVDVVTARFNTELAVTDLGPDRVAGSPPDQRVPYAPNGVYRSADGRWVAISVFNDDQWSTLVGILGSPSSLADGRWAGIAGRRDGADDLDAALASGIGRLDAFELADPLAQRGVPASLVMTPAEVFTAADGVDDAYLPYTEHPLWGRRRLPGLPWCLVDRPTSELLPPPCLGNARDAAGSWAGSVARAVDALGIDTDGTHPGEAETGER